MDTPWLILNHLATTYQVGDKELKLVTQSALWKDLILKTPKGSIWVLFSLNFL